MKVAEKKRSIRLSALSWTPLTSTRFPWLHHGAIENHGYLVVDEEHNRWSGFLCGREGQAMFDILSKETGKLDNSNLRPPGTRWLPGDTRFWLMWPETLNRGQELRFLSLLEHLLLKSEIRRQDDGSGHHAISGHQWQTAQRVWAVGVSDRQ